MSDVSAGVSALSPVVRRRTLNTLGMKRRAKAVDTLLERIQSVHTSAQRAGCPRNLADVLEAFLHEYRIFFPVGVDQPATSGPWPMMMAAYGMRGTPTTLIFDRCGRLARHSFGAEDDLALGMLLGRLLGR